MSGIRQSNFRKNQTIIEREKNEQKKRYLARRIGYCIAATIAEIKPVTVMTLANVRGRVFDLWEEFGNDLFNNSHLNYYELKKSEKSAVVLFFSRRKLNELLRKEETRHFLCSFGYNVDQSLEEILSLLKEKFNSYPFPHEIGVFLGIPLKDIKAFMGLNFLPCLKINRWRIYGDVEESLAVIKKYKQAEEEVRTAFFKKDPIKIIENG